MTETKVHWGDDHKPPPATATREPHWLAFFENNATEVWGEMRGTHYPGLIAVVGPFPGQEPTS